MRDVPESAHDQTQKIGIVKPALQQGWAKFAQDLGEP
jgi:hypothetical protein